MRISISLFCSSILLFATTTKLVAQGAGYLDVPRLSIAGRFYADPSSINNDPKHYKRDATRPSPWQEPLGRHHWQLRDCTIRSIVDASGNEVSNDPLYGAVVSGTDSPAVAKMIDLDVYQQAVSTIYGFQLKIAISKDVELIGDMDPATLNSVWFERVLPTRGWNQQYGWGSFGADANASGVFQTLVRVKTGDWPQSHGSKTLDQLRKAADVVDGKVLLSFRFVLDNFMNVESHQDFRLGRFTGCIGPGRANAAAKAPGCRWLVARRFPEDGAWYVPRFYSGPFRVDRTRKRLVVDLANSLCQQKPGGPVVNLGDFEAVILMEGAEPKRIGRLDYSDFRYENNSGISEVSLNDEHLRLLENHRLALVTSRDDIGPQVLFAESPTGLCYAVDDRVQRITSEPGSPLQQVSSRIFVTKWGKPAAGIRFGVKVVPVFGTTPGNTGTRGSPGDTFDALGVLDAEATPSDEHGVSTITLRAVKNPHRRTSQLDGQLYFVYVYADPNQFPGIDAQAEQTQEHQISVLVWSQYRVKTKPAWDDVRQIMEPYAKLYPAMTELIDLTDEHSFKMFADNPPWVAFGEAPDYNVMGIKKGAIPYLMTRDMNDPRHMPITRDLSPNKLKTILYWIKNNQPVPQEAREERGE